jgi:hypothetical protein
MPASIETPQAIPTNGSLAENMNLSYGELAEQVSEKEGAAYSYVVKSVRMDDEGQQFEQHGSAPNFQGGRLTLCTCKHQMRTSLECKAWQGTWVAGFTSRCLDVVDVPKGRHWLFYLTRVNRAYPSHAELWESLPAAAREAKSASAHFLGDLFAPRGRVAGDGRFDPSRYYTPSRHSHRHNSCDNGWHNDIDYWCADLYGRPSLLVGDPHRTFIWNEPIIWFDDDHCRNFKKWDSIRRLLLHLKEAA